MVERSAKRKGGMLNNISEMQHRELVTAPQCEWESMLKIGQLAHHRHLLTVAAWESMGWSSLLVSPSLLRSFPPISRRPFLPPRVPLFWRSPTSSSHSLQYGCPSPAILPVSPLQYS